ncbi:MAG: AAA family ATPase, partial [Candidatus Micrarchaeota archaeon]|nr:AAA family ATPase [Candidatus Micrarchaeota archaeon]
AMMRRFDDVFFLDFPSLEERRHIIGIMNKKYNTNIPESFADRMENWTGAEIEKLAFSSLYDGLDEAFQSIRTIYHQCRESIEKAREWAKFNARLANGNGQTQSGGRKLKIN